MTIHWPDRYAPERVAVRVRNEIAVEATPERVWAWLIEPRGAGCWVLTEEHQNGLAARAQALFMPSRMREGHDVWLAALRAKAEG